MSGACPEIVKPLELLKLAPGYLHRVQAVEEQTDPKDNAEPGAPGNLPAIGESDGRYSQQEQNCQTHVEQAEENQQGRSDVRPGENG